MRLMPLAPGGAHHHASHQHQAGCRRLGGDELNDRHQHRRQKEEDGRGHGAEPRATALLHSSRRLVVNDHLGSKAYRARE